MRKTLALLLCLAICLSLLSACGGADKESGNKGSSNGGDATLVIGIPKNTLVTDYENNYYTQWLEEKTGYDLKFQYFAAGATDYKTQLSASVAGDLELPDILVGFNLGTELYERYGSDGVFMDLAPYFNDREKSAAWWERFEQLDQESQDNNWRRMQASDGSGAIYAFPEIQESMIDIMDYQVWINQEWLDAVNMPMPSDPESLYNVLVAFRDRDPNGNGLPDEIPLIGTMDTLSGCTLDWLINMFVYEDDTTYFNVDEDGQLYSPYRTDAYRKALQYIRKLYAEGLMSPLTLTCSTKELLQLTCPPEGDTHKAGVVCTHLTLGFVQDHEGLLAYEAMPMWGNTVCHENIHAFNVFVTKDCENPDAAWNLLMCMSSEESSIIQRYGKQGENWDWAEEGTTSVMGTDAMIRLYKDPWSTIGNENWRLVVATILFNAEGEGNQAVPAEEAPVRQHKYDLFNQALENYRQQAANHNPAENLICPLLVWPQEYKDEALDVREDCKEYIKKARTDFITGVLDINSDADWQKYLDRLDELGYEQWLFYSQLIYEETMTQ